MLLRTDEMLDVVKTHRDTEKVRLRRIIVKIDVALRKLKYVNCA
jgi:hypothetical protein